MYIYIYIHEATYIQAFVRTIFMYTLHTYIHTYMHADKYRQVYKHTRTCSTYKHIRTHTPVCLKFARTDGNICFIIYSHPPVVCVCVYVCVYTYRVYVGTCPYYTTYDVLAYAK